MTRKKRRSFTAAQNAEAVRKQLKDEDPLTQKCRTTHPLKGGNAYLDGLLMLLPNF